MIHQSGSVPPSKQKRSLRSCGKHKVSNGWKGVGQASTFLWGKGRGSIMQINSVVLIRKCHIDWLKVTNMREMETTIKS